MARAAWWGSIVMVAGAAVSGCMPNFEPTGPGMSDWIEGYLTSNYLVEWEKQTGSADGCSRDQVKLEHQGQIASGVHDYVVQGCGELTWRVFTECKNPDRCADITNILTLEKTARFDLECKDAELSYEVLGGSIGVSGCGRKATYIAGAKAWEMDSPVTAIGGKAMANALGEVKTPAAPKPELVTAAPQGSAYGFVVGVGKYRDLPAAKGARADAESVAAMMKKTLGITGDRLRVALDDRATAADIRRGLRWLGEQTPAGGRAYFYFSGHGAPAPENGTTYLVPYDGDPLALKDSALELDGVLGGLGEGKAKETVAMIDSCFSGSGGRSVLPEGTRPLVRVKEPVAPHNLVVLTASTGAETSGARADKRLGLFTSYLLEGLGRGKADIDGDAQITVKEIVDWVGPRVSREAKKAGREQTPRALGDAPGLVLVHGLSGTN